MKSNPILEEVWRIKDELAREANYDIHQFCENTRRWAAEHPKLFEMYQEQIPLGDFGQAEDLGPLAVYLASDAARYVTGAAIVIDGGYTLW